MRKLLLTCLTSMLLLTGLPLSAPATPLASHEQLALLGYRVGMSLAEARLLRPFQEVHTNARYAQTHNSLVAFIDTPDQPITPRRCALGFRNDALFKVVVTYDLEDLATIKWRLEEILGGGESAYRLTGRAPVPVNNSAWVWQSLADQIVLITIPSNLQTFTLVLQRQR